MGVVYRARDWALGVDVALKTVPSPAAADVHQLKQEFRALADIHHPNLVELYDLVAQGDECFFTMELLTGSDLVTHAAACEARGGALRALAVQLLEGLAALHRAGVVHRDIKPSNIMVTVEGRAVLLDFGLAGIMREYGKPGNNDERAFVGTLLYMSPEQVTSAAVGAPTDLYALGAVLYEALAGAPPFDGSPQDVVSKKWSCDPAPIRERAPGAPRDLCDLITALLARAAEKRPNARQAIATLRGKAPVADRPTNGGPADARPFVGRATQLRALRRVFESLERDAAPAVVKVYGASGVGKSTLVQQFCDAVAVDAGALVLAGRCHPNEAVPYKALDAVIDRLALVLADRPAPDRLEIEPAEASALLRLFPAFEQVPWVRGTNVNGGTSLVDVRRKGIEALRRILRSLARERPIVVWIDDVQWSDLDSALLLRELLGPLGPAQLMLALSHRTEDRQSPILDALKDLSGEAVAAPRVEELEVPPLSEEDARVLLGAALGGAELSPTSAAAIVRQAQGTPYLLCEAAQFWRESEERDEAPRWAPGDDLREVFRARLARMPAEAQGMLEIVSLAGGPISREAAARAADAGPGGSAVLMAMCRAKLLRQASGDEGAVQVFHDRIRDALLGDLPPTRRQGLHGHLADALESTGCTDFGLLAVHHAEAGRRERAAGFARRAADQSMSALAFDRGIRFYEMALALGTRSAEVEALLGHANAAAGRTVAASEWMLRAAEGAPRDAALRHRQFAAELLIGAGHLGRGTEVLRTVLASVGMRLPSRGWPALVAALYWRARLKARGLDFTERAPENIPGATLARIDACWTVAGSLGFFDAVSAFGFQTRHTLLALDSGDLSRIARALAMELVYVETTGRGGGRVRELASRLEELWGRLGRTDERAFLLLAQGFRQLHAGQFGAAIESLSRGEALYSTLRAARWEQNMCRTHRVFALTLSGRLAESAQAEAKLSAELLAEEDISAASNLGLISGYTAELSADRPDRARERVDTALRPWAPSLPLSFEFLAVMADVRIHLYRGEARAAFDRLEGAWDRVKPIQAYQSERIVLNWLRGLSALSIAGAPRVGVAKEAAKRIAREKMAWSAGYASTLEAGVALLARDRGGARAALGRATEEFSAAGMALDGAAVARWAGGLTRNGGVGRADAEETMKRLGVACVERWLRLHVPVDLV